VQASANTVLLAGAIPRFADIRADNTFNLDPDVPVTEAAARETMFLPTFPGLSERDQRGWR
jgi:dTDP-4-amino-4,6-dideoxygalactose transaminase